MTWDAMSCWGSEANRRKGSVLPALHGKGKAAEPETSDEKTFAEVSWWQGEVTETGRCLRGFCAYFCQAGTAWAPTLPLPLMPLFIRPP